jgi:hypothetical protein
LAGRKADYAKIADENVMHGQNPKIMLPIRPVPYGSGNFLALVLSLLQNLALVFVFLEKHLDCMSYFLWQALL